MEKLRQRMAKVRATFTQISHRFASRIHRLRIGIIALIVVISFAIILSALSLSWVGVTREIGTGGLPLSACDPSAVPQTVAEDAVRLSTELFGDCQEERDTFIGQLLAMYCEARDKDFIVFFNPGGWGWNLIEKSPGWWSILSGIESELESSGYISSLLNYQRTVDSLRGQLNELVEMINGYSSKANDLAYRVEFLTSHISNLKVILAGESTGTVICDRAMNILKDNPQVYCIQTGPPFWHENNMSVRTLVLTDNGIIPDSFSRGDFLTIIRANLKSLFGSSQSESDSGEILHYIVAPGHQYWWQYPEVGSQIKNFLDENFRIKW